MSSKLRLGQTQQQRQYLTADQRLDDLLHLCESTDPVYLLRIQLIKELDGDERPEPTPSITAIVTKNGLTLEGIAQNNGGIGTIKGTYSAGMFKCVYTENEKEIRLGLPVNELEGEKPKFNGYARDQTNFYHASATLMRYDRSRLQSKELKKLAKEVDNARSLHAEAIAYYQ